MNRDCHLSTISGEHVMAAFHPYHSESGDLKQPQNKLAVHG